MIIITFFFFLRATRYLGEAFFHFALFSLCFPSRRTLACLSTSCTMKSSKPLLLGADTTGLILLVVLGSNV